MLCYIILYCYISLDYYTIHIYIYIHVSGVGKWVVVVIRGSPDAEVAANPRAETLDLRGFHSSRILILRGGILTSTGNFPNITKFRKSVLKSKKMLEC